MNGQDPCVIRTAGLTRSFAGFTAVNRLDLGIRRGTIHALIGPNGAGKTTVFNLLSGFLSPTAGQIFLDGRDITGTPPARVARLGMVRSFQISAVFPHLTAAENVRMALQSPTGLTYQFWRAQRSLRRLQPRVGELLESVGLAGLAHVAAGELSYGRKRMLELATTLALEPRVLLLDEPMSGLGLEDVGKVSDLIREAARGRTVVMVEHNLSVVASLSDRITVLARGEILAEGSYAEVSGDAAVRKAYMGTGDE